MDGTTSALTQPSDGTAPLKERANGAAAASVLVAVDMSMDSRAALLWAGDYAAKADLELAVLHVLHDPAEAPGTYSRNASSPLTPMSDTAEEMLSEFMADACSDRPELRCLAEAKTRVVNGLPAGTIVEEAMQLGAALIVMGSRGQTGLSRLLYGSTAEQVLQLSPIPVTVVKART